MDEPEDLTPAQLEEFRDALAKLRGELEELVALSEGGTKPVELDQSSVGRVSRIDAIQVQQMAKANRRNHELRLAQVGQALRRMERDEYGWCIRCEEPIGYRRLSARPETPMCLGCQGASERGGR